MISNKFSSGKENYEYFSGYRDDYFKIKPFYTLLLET